MFIYLFSDAIKNREETLDISFKLIEEKIDSRVKSIKQMADQIGENMKANLRKMKKNKFTM